MCDLWGKLPGYFVTLVLRRHAVNVSPIVIGLLHLFDHESTQGFSNYRHTYPNFIYNARLQIEN